MNYQLSKNEFGVLTFLHENAKAYDDTSAFHPKEIAKAVGISDGETRKVVSYLTSLELAGVKEVEMHSGYMSMVRASMNRRIGPIRTYQKFFLTGFGEQFMRALEDQILSGQLEAPEAEPGTAQKITLKVAGFVYDLGKAVIVKVLADSMTGKH